MSLPPGPSPFISSLVLGFGIVRPSSHLNYTNEDLWLTQGHNPYPHPQTLVYGFAVYGAAFFFFLNSGDPLSLRQQDSVGHICS